MCGIAQEIALEAVGCLRNLAFSHAGAISIILERSVGGGGLVVASGETIATHHPGRVDGNNGGPVLDPLRDLLNPLRDLKKMLKARRGSRKRRGVLEILGRVLAGCGCSCGDPLRVVRRGGGGGGGGDEELVSLRTDETTVVEYGGRVQFEALAV